MAGGRCSTPPTRRSWWVLPISIRAMPSTRSTRPAEWTPAPESGCWPRSGFAGSIPFHAGKGGAEAPPFFCPDSSGLAFQAGELLPEAGEALGNALRIANHHARDLKSRQGQAHGHAVVVVGFHRRPPQRPRRNLQEIGPLD